MNEMMLDEKLICEMIEELMDDNMRDAWDMIEEQEKKDPSTDDSLVLGLLYEMLKSQEFADTLLKAYKGIGEFKSTYDLYDRGDLTPGQEESLGEANGFETAEALSLYFGDELNELLDPSIPSFSTVAFDDGAYSREDEAPILSGLQHYPVTINEAYKEEETPEDPFLDKLRKKYGKKR